MPDPQKQPPIHWILFFAHLVACALFGVVGFVIRAQNGAPGEPGTGPLASLSGSAPLDLLAVLTFSAVVVTVARPFLSALLAGRVPKLQWVILRLALGESVALFGIPGFMLGATPAWFVLMVAWGIGLVALAAPSEAAFRDYDEKARENLRRKG